MTSKSHLIFLLFPFILIVADFHFAQAQHKFTLVVNTPHEISQEMGIGEAFYREQYQSAKLANSSAFYDNGKYVFTGELLYPTAIRIFRNAGGPQFNHLVFIDSGYQEMEMSIKDSQVLIIKRPATAIEADYQQFLRFMKVTDVNQPLSSGLFENYVHSNPGSYVALFFLIDQSFQYGYHIGLKRLSSRFTAAIINTKGFRYYEEQYIEKKINPCNLLFDNKGQIVGRNLSISAIYGMMEHSGRLQ